MDKIDSDLTKDKRVEVGAPLRLMGMGYACLLLIYFLPLVWWGIILKVLFGIFLIVVIKGSFHPMWDQYETMGAFVTLQTIWFAGFLWVPDHFLFLRYIFGFLIVLGILTKYKQIEHINKGLGPNLKRN